MTKTFEEKRSNGVNVLRHYVKEHVKHGYQRSNDPKSVKARKLRKKKKRHSNRFKGN